jgi:hypothetical protein
VALDAELKRLEAGLRALAEKKEENGARAQEDAPAHL